MIFKNLHAYERLDLTIFPRILGQSFQVVGILVNRLLFGLRILGMIDNLFNIRSNFSGMLVRKDDNTFILIFGVPGEHVLIKIPNCL